MKTEDGYIVHECLNGDKSAFAILIDKYKAAVFAIAYDKLRNFHDAQDIAQEVFIKAFQKLGTLKNYDKFAVWIHSITNNLCKNHIRSQSRRPDSEFIEDQRESLIDSNSMRSFKDDIENEMINDALNSLPEIYRQVLTLHYLGGMKDSEIAEFLGMSHTNVRQKLMKARTQLKEEMISMMDRAFEEQKLQAGFTFRLVEMVKRTKIHPITQARGLPWGLSLATGLLIAVLSINPALISFDHIGTPIYSPLPVESKVLKVGEIPVDVAKISNIAILSSKVGKGNGGEPENMQNAFFMAPRGEGGVWAKKADMPTARISAKTVVVDGKIYTIGGGTNNNLQLKTIEMYDPSKDVWSKKANMNVGRIYHMVAEFNNKIYAFGGMNLDATNTSSMEVYDPLADTWTKEDDMPIALSLVSTVVLEGKIYLIGGWGVNIPLAAYKSVYTYDPLSKKWEKETDLLFPSYAGEACVVNGKIYYIGGFADWSPSSNVQEYDPKTHKWTLKANIPHARGAFALCLLNNKIYAIGGEANGKTLYIIDIYDPEKNEWIDEIEIPEPRSWFSASEFNGKIIMAGGTHSFTGIGWPPADFLPLVEEYTPEVGKSISQQGKLPNTWGKIKQNR